jgi:hypothetical protein
LGSSPLDICLFVFFLLAWFLHSDLAMFDWQAELAASAPPSPQIVSAASLAVSDSPQLITVPPKSFAAALGGHRSSPLEEAPYSVPCIKGDALSIRIGHDVNMHYEDG